MIIYYLDTLTYGYGPSIFSDLVDVPVPMVRFSVRWQLWWDFRSDGNYGEILGQMSTMAILSWIIATFGKQFNVMLWHQCYKPWKSHQEYCEHHDNDYIISQYTRAHCALFRFVSTLSIETNLLRFTIDSKQNLPYNQSNTTINGTDQAQSIYYLYTTGSMWEHKQQTSIQTTINFCRWV